MAHYSGDKHMDPLTQLKVFYKRKGIPLTPFGWFVVCCCLIFLFYQLYSLAHAPRKPPVFEETQTVKDGIIAKEVRQGESVDDKIKMKVTEHVINELGESGLAGGQVLGKLHGKKKEDKTVVEGKEEKTEEKSQNPEAPDPKPRPNPRDPRFRVTLDPAEFGGQIVELKRPDVPDEYNNGKDAMLPNVEPFVRDDRLVPQAHLEHIPKPQPKAIQVDLRFKPKFEKCPKYDMIILVHSEAMNSELRTGIRATWYDSKNYARFKNDTNLWKVIFIIGRTYDSYDDHVKLEAEDNNDLIQADFVESEYEETRKFVLGTNYIVETFKNCAPKFVMKTKDNIFLNMISIEGWLRAKFKTARKLYVGNYMKREQPNRDWTHPLYVSKAEYGKVFYPGMLSGPVYLFSFDVVESMTSLYRAKPPIASEEGYIGILMEMLKVKPRHNEHFWLLGMHGNKCNYLRQFFIQNVKPLDHLRLMTSNREARNSTECLKARHYDLKSGKMLDDENPS